eukprot:TRINITY_DN30000_c0_g2_i3.p1 TRINITY_DN30000_c0_g2~~TRINITY_DN30000_c0_g2_i3.p1  ORF type:complete len:543 (+),score=136.83 TRINITY_DN30000_c0_g2_i3:65-1693(+)
MAGPLRRAASCADAFPSEATSTSFFYSESGDGAAGLSEGPLADIAGDLVHAQTTGDSIKVGAAAAAGSSACRPLSPLLSSGRQTALGLHSAAGHRAPPPALPRFEADVAPHDGVCMEGLLGAAADAAISAADWQSVVSGQQGLWSDVDSISSQPLHQAAEVPPRPPHLASRCDAEDEGDALVDAEALCCPPAEPPPPEDVDEAAGGEVVPLTPLEDALQAVSADAERRRHPGDFGELQAAARWQPCGSRQYDREHNVVIHAMTPSIQSLRYPRLEVSDPLGLQTCDHRAAIHAGRSAFWRSRDDVLQAVSLDGRALQHAAQQFRSDVEVVFAAVAQNGLALQDVLEPLRNDPEVVIAAVQSHGGALEYTDSSIRRDRRIVVVAVAQYGPALKFAADELQSDRQVVLTAVKQDGRAVQYAAGPLRCDLEVAFTAVQSAGTAIRYIPLNVRSNFHMGLEAVKQDGLALEWLPTYLRRNHQVVAAAVQQNGKALRFAAAELRQDRGFVELALAASPEAGLFSKGHLRGSFLKAGDLSCAWMEVAA